MKNRIKELRQEIGKNQTQLGELLGVAQNTVSYWESGTCEPDIESLCKLSDLFNCSVDYILMKTNNPKPYPLSLDDLIDITENNDIDPIPLVRDSIDNHYILYGYGQSEFLKECKKDGYYYNCENNTVSLSDLKAALDEFKSILPLPPNTIKFQKLPLSIKSISKIETANDSKISVYNIALPSVCNQNISPAQQTKVAAAGGIESAPNNDNAELETAYFKLAKNEEN